MNAKRFPFGAWWTVLGVAAVLAAAGAAGPAAPAPEPAPPAPPAVHTRFLSRITAIQGDSFTYNTGRETVRIRLADADSSELDPVRLEQAAVLATQLLQEEPVWMFPCGAMKAGTEVKARVWTRKGWLSEVLIKAGLAKRTAGAPAGAFDPAPEATQPPETPVPPPPAFAARIEELVAGDTFQVTHEGRPVRLRLYDVTCEAGSDRAKEVAAQAMGTEPVWIFPSSQRKLNADEDLPVRIWTARGWLADILAAASAAQRYPDPDKALQERLAGPSGRPEPAPAPAPGPRSAPPAPKIVWRQVTITAAKSDLLSVESDPFEIPAAEWRIAWNLKTVRKGGQVNIVIFQVDPEWATAISHTVVCSFKGAAGSGVVRYPPGKFWIRITGTTELNVKVEYAEAAEP